MSENQPIIEGGPNPCQCCPFIVTQAPMDKLIAVGFGTAMVTCDGDMVIDGENPHHDDLITFADAEAMASADPEHDWRVVLRGPLHGETYQRHGPQSWHLIERNEGFA